MWSQRPVSAATSAMSDRGSTVPVSVVPPEPTTRKGRRPLRRSASTRDRSEAGSIRSMASISTVLIWSSPNPARRAALETEWWV